jgi:hypothetical protein
MEAAGKIYLLYVHAGTILLLDMHLRFHDLFGLYGRELLGDDMQRGSLDLPRLRRHTQLWKRLRFPDDPAC